MPKMKSSSVKRGNGTGSVFFNKQKGKYIARMPILYYVNSDGKLRTKTKQIGSFDTYDEAYLALLKAMENYDPEVGYVEKKEHTLNDVYEMWHASDKYLKLSDSAKKNYDCAYKKLSFLYKRPIKSIEFTDVEEFFKLNADHSGTAKDAKVCLSHIFEYALKRKMVDENITKYISLTTKKSKKHKFIDLELRKLIWDKCNDVINNSTKDTTEVKACRIILIQMWTGMRVNELHRTLLENVHLDENYIITGSKSTADGRIVPIHPQIKEHVEYIFKHSKDKKHLCEFNYTKSIEQNTIDRVNDFLKEFDCLSHDFRDTFKTLWLNQKLNYSMINVAIGHLQPLYIDNIYYKPSPEVLVEENNKFDLFRDK